MTPGLIVYFLCEDMVEIVRFLGRDQYGCVIDFGGGIQRVKEEALTIKASEVAQYIENRIKKYEARIVVLKAKRQEFKPLMLEHE
jgi:hypothetical protein